MASSLWCWDNSDKTLAWALRDSQCCFISFTRIFFSSWSLWTPMTLSKTSFFVLKSAEPVIHQYEKFRPLHIACSFRDHFCHTYAHLVRMQICPLEHLNVRILMMKCVFTKVLCFSINLRYWHFSFYATFFFYCTTSQKKVFYFLLHYNFKDT